MLKKIGIKESNILRVNRDTLSFYNDEKVILITNGCFYTFPNTHIFPISKNIIPFYFGLHLTEEWGTREFIINNREQIKNFKNFGPVGCRDRGTANWLRTIGIKSYYTRCLTFTIPKRTEFCRHKPEKVFLVETPEELDNYIPDEYKDKLEKLTHWPHPLPQTPISENYVEKYNQEALQILERYKKEAALVVTKRFHCAIPCIAMGIPVIVLHENPNNERMSPLSDITKIYSYKELNKINWHPKPIDIESLKKEIELSFFINLNKFDKKHKLSSLHHYKIANYTAELILLKLYNWFKYKNKLVQLNFTLKQILQYEINKKNKFFQFYIFNNLPQIIRLKLRIFNFIFIDFSIGKLKDL